MENFDEFLVKSTAFEVRDSMINSKIKAQKVNIQSPLPHPAAQPENIEVDYVTGYIIITARGKEKTENGHYKDSEEYLFYKEDIRPAYIKSDAEASAFMEMVNKRKTELMDRCKEQFGQCLLGEINP
jgi:hypothetical protein